MAKDRSAPDSVLGRQAWSALGLSAISAQMMASAWLETLAWTGAMALSMPVAVCSRASRMAAHMSCLVRKPLFLDSSP